MIYTNIFFTLFFILLLVSNYSYSKFSLFLFFISSIIFLNYSFRKKSNFIDKFAGLFLFLCFWINYSFKMSLKLFFNDSDHFFLDGIGYFIFNDDNLNFVFAICIVTYLAISLVSFIREKFFIYQKDLTYTYYGESLKKIYDDKKIFILLIFIIFLISIAYINISNSIFLRGVYTEDINKVIYNFFGLLILYLIPAFTCYLIDLNNSIKKSNFISIIYALIEPPISNFGINSRNSIFGSIAYFIGMMFSNFFKIYNYQKIIISLLILFFFITNFLFVSHFFSNRENLKFWTHETVMIYEKEKINKQSKINIQNKEYNHIKKKTFIETKEELISRIRFELKPYFYSDIFVAIISRLIGIEGIMSVVGNKDKLNFHLLYNALIYKEATGKISFYDQFKGSDRGGNTCDEKKCLSNFSLMGLFAFLMYSGSLIFLFCALFFIFILFSLIEFLAYKFTKNKILCAYMSQLIIYRCIHFGYRPLDSYKFFFSIILAIVIVFVINKFLNHLANKFNALS